MNKGVEVKCSEFKECVCEIIDHRLSEERTKELMQHAHACPHCNFELHSMQSTKEIVHTKLRRSSVPSEVYYSIINATLNSSNSSWFKRLFGFQLNPAIAFVALAVVAVGIYSMFIPSNSGMPEDANIIAQSMKNYQAVIGGVIKPQLVSSEDGVRSFLTNGVPFDVNVPKMKGCSSCAAVLSEFNGVKLAHVVYQVDGKDIIYIYQASMNDAMDGTTIGLPEEAREELKRTDWYVREMSDSTTLVMWRYKNTLCSAVSGMKKEQMIALLTEKDLTE
ncbi:MAG: hypothetical protein KA247_03320 [Bacteroidetes bacterium]|nr:hypothetical protein [Bacteroidota bacterium]